MKKLDSYEINASTLLLLPYKDKYTKIVEKDCEYLVEEKTMEIIKNSCNFYGSSYDGRVSGSKDLLNASIKLPIIIEESNLVLFFPTNSPRNSDCIWISYNNLLKYCKNEDKVDLYFQKSNVVSIPISFYILDNQIIRCIKLVTELEKRKKCLKTCS